MFALIAAVILFVPAPPPTADEIDWDCQFGRIEQIAKKITVTGPSWTAAGEVRPDGTIILFWHSGSERTAIGVYRRAGDEIVGHWGWADSVEIGANGDICHKDGGALNSETLVRRKAQ